MLSYFNTLGTSLCRLALFPIFEMLILMFTSKATNHITCQRDLTGAKLQNMLECSTGRPQFSSCSSIGLSCDTRLWKLLQYTCSIP
jgi:hypothetical protein